MLDFGSRVEAERLLGQLPAWIQDAALLGAGEDFDQLEEIALDLGGPVMITCAGQSSVFEGHGKRPLVSEKDLEYVLYRLGEFRDDNRRGVEGTLHRISALRDEHRSIVGLTLRFARAVYGVAEPLRGLVLSSEGLLVVGAPGTGKTTLLRDIVRIKGEIEKSKVVVVDTSGEIGGDSAVAHPMLGEVRRLKVPSKAVQYKTILEAVKNHGPRTIVIDEIETREEVDSLLDVSKRGVFLIASVHGRGAHSPVQNRVINPLLGYPDLKTGLLDAEAIFETMVVVVKKGLYHVYTDLTETIPRLARGESVAPIVV